MTQKTLPVPYQIETFGAETKREGPASAGGPPPRRSSAFLAQLLVAGDPALRIRLGRADLADQRAGAYAGAIGRLPSRNGLHATALLSA